jgi:glutathionyl-hydroquinone reductase
MGMLINGKWEKDPLIKTNKKGEFIRQESVFNNTINIIPQGI